MPHQSRAGRNEQRCCEEGEDFGKPEPFVPVGSADGVYFRKKDCRTNRFEQPSSGKQSRKTLVPFPQSHRGGESDMEHHDDVDVKVLFQGQASLPNLYQTLGDVRTLQFET